MIVKVKVTEKIWQFFDGAREVRKEVHRRQIPDAGEPGGNSGWDQIGGQHGKYLCDIEQLTIREDAFDFTNGTCSQAEADAGVVELWLYGKEKSDIRQILCYRPAYLLSDDGKTIEKL